MDVCVRYRNDTAEYANAPGMRASWAKPAGSRAGLPARSALAGVTLRGPVIATALAAIVPVLAPSEVAAQFVCGSCRVELTFWW